jgi:hypothetical protein
LYFRILAGNVVFWYYSCILLFNTLAFAKGPGALPMKLQTILDPVEASPPETQTQPLRRSGGWTLFALPRIGLHLHSDGEQLLLANRTAISWVIYHKFHQLGVIDADETLLLSLPKYGSLSVRPHGTNDNAEFLVLPLHHTIQQVVIYRHAMGANIEIYDMKGMAI